MVDLWNQSLFERNRRDDEEGRNRISDEVERNRRCNEGDEVERLRKLQESLIDTILKGNCLREKLDYKFHSID